MAGILRRSGLKATHPRIALLNVIAESSAPVSAQEAAKRVGKKMDQATIYRAFNTLKSKKIIRQVDLRHNHAHYELFDYDDHHHMICISCGKVEDISGCEVESMYSAFLRAARSFATIEQHSLEFYGVCKTCAEKTQRKTHTIA
ncbi:MAG: transcriptional repressor [Candidatus Sungbacteria bacterium]|nr:transcriptional repressor [Candidatus Sungbacteria bacterium]